MQDLNEFEERMKARRKRADAIGLVVRLILFVAMAIGLLVLEIWSDGVYVNWLLQK